MRENIIGEDLNQFLINEIKKRQEIQGSGYDSPRENSHVQFLNNRNSWLKMGSSVIILDPSQLVNPLFKEISKGIGLSENNSYLGVIHNIKNDKSSPSKSTFSLYNEGGIDPLHLSKYGNVPPPGIESFNIKTLNRGSIRKGTLRMKAFSKAQFDVIDFLFFRPGFSMMVEWGWDKGISKDGKIYEYPRDTILDDFWWKGTSEETTHLSMINIINELRQKYEGNYDGFFGKISNFEWNLGPDGVYDIIISLISMGDVIESLNLNLAPQYTIIQKPSRKDYTLDPEDDDVISEQRKESFRVQGDGRFLADSNIVKGAESNQLCNILYQSIGERKYLDESEYYSLEDSIDVSYLNQAIDDRYNYYITFSELIWLIEYHLVPSISNNGSNPSSFEKIIKFDINMDVSNKTYIPIFPNQIAFDPTVCIFEHKDNIGYNNVTLKTNNREEMSSKGELKFVPLGLSEESDKGVNKGKQFIEEIKIENNEIIRFGNLNNLFINFDFISKCLLDGTNEKGEMNLFNFLKKLCDGINRALGNVNQIEPVIKEDKIIVFIDKQPIPGTKAFRKIKGIKDDEDYNIEIWGYNTEGKTVKSNFVKDFKFKTKITPHMASQISIGVTAHGSKTSTINGTIFEQWNRGLKDKFSQYSLNPSPYEKMESGDMKRIKEVLRNINSTIKYKDELGLNPNELYKELKDERAEIYNLINNINEGFILNDYGYYLIEAFGGQQYINSKENLQSLGLSEEEIRDALMNANISERDLYLFEKIQNGEATPEEEREFRDNNEDGWDMIWNDVKEFINYKINNPVPVPKL